MTSTKTVFFLVVGILGPIVVLSFPGERDLVRTLPGISSQQHSHRHYSGFLNSTRGSQMHYWLFEAETSEPRKAPVVLWLQGGPGCSSLYGAFSELGPIRLEMNGSLTRNQHTWAKIANLLFLESPVGVGFSYRPGANYYPGSDVNTVQENMAALRSFFRKFPHLLHNEFFITGESYAGVFVPTLSLQALKEQFPLNFSGVAIGNGLLSWDIIAPIWAGKNASSLTHFMYFHGLTNRVDKTETKKIVDKLPMIYNILKNCRSTLGTGATLLGRSSPVDPDSLRGVDATLPWCDNTFLLEDYFNRQDVRKAIHVGVPELAKLQFRACNYEVYEEYDKQVKDTSSYVRKMIASGLKVLIYYGDLDAICNFVGGKWFTEKLGPVQQNWGPWFVNGNRHWMGGVLTHFERNLTYTTIKGAGHMVPADQPEAAYQMFSEFLQGRFNAN